MKVLDAIPGISDGLLLSCSDCACRVDFDYKVSDTFWRSLVQPPIRQSVLCLRCLDLRVEKAGQLLYPHLECVQFAGHSLTIVLRPSEIYRFDAQSRAEGP